MQIAIIGTGYVGLVSGACFSEQGFSVRCIDKDDAKVQGLCAGKVHIYEPGLDEVVARNSVAGRLSFFNNLEEGIKDADVIFIAVGTPTGAEDGAADLSYVYAVAEELAPLLGENSVIVTKSTVPVGTGQRIKKIIAGLRADLSFHVVSNPEFLREGCAVDDFLNPDRVIVGVESEYAKNVMQSLYKPMSDRDIPVFMTDLESSELSKYAANAFLATKIGFINEIADMCEAVGANIEHVAEGMGMDKRIGRSYLSPGPGFGGSCFPKDTLALTKTARDADCPSKIVEAVVHSNESRKSRMANKVISALGGNANGKHIAVLGLAFKANTDDLRYSPSLRIIPALLDAGATVAAFDPEAQEGAKHILKDDIRWADDSYDCLENADVAVIITEWDIFKTLDLGRVKQALKQPLIVDLRNLYRTAEMQEAGIEYYSVGRKTVASQEDTLEKRA